MKEIDLMEYSTDELARAAYVSNIEVEPEVTYPNGYSDTYVKATSQQSTSLIPGFSVDPTLPKTGSVAPNSWASLAGQPITQRFHIAYAEPFVLNKIYYEPYHETGGGTVIGGKDFTLWGSNIEASFNDLTYSHDTGWTQITGVETNVFAQHVASDVLDPKYITVVNSTMYKYYAFKLSTNYGHSGQIGIARHIELYAANTVFSVFSEDTIKTQGDYSLKLVSDVPMEAVRTLPPGVSKESGNLFIEAESDISDYNGTHTITAQGGVALSAAQKCPYNNSTKSVYFDGADDYLETPDHADWDFDSGDFTIDMFVRLDDLAGNKTFCGQYATSLYWGFSFHATSGLTLYLNNGGEYLAVRQNNVTGWVVGTWYHIAAVRSGTSWAIYKDGVLLNSITSSLDFLNFTNAFIIGQVASSAYMKGYLDNIRITKGKALWTAAFTLSDETLGYTETQGEQIDLSGVDTIKLDARSNVVGNVLDVTLGGLGTFDDINAWEAYTNGLSEAKSLAVSHIIGDYIYLFGGYHSGFTNTVLRASIDSNGVVGTWSSYTNSLSLNTAQAPTVRVGNYIYLIGGRDASNFKATVIRATVNDTTGDVGVWGTHNNSLPIATGDNQAIIIGDYVYTFGGYQSNYVATVYKAAVNHTSGDIGAWGTYTSLPSSRASYNLVRIENYLYIIGGITSAAYTDTILRAPVDDAAGTVGTWSSYTNSLSEIKAGAAHVIIGDYLYLFGGHNAGGKSDTVIRAAIDATGNLGVWGTYSALDVVRDSGVCINTGSYLYIFGGSDSTGELTSVSRSEVPPGSITHAVDLTQVNTWEEQTIDISGIPDANKSALSEIKFEVNVATGPSFSTVLYTGTEANHSVTGAGFSPGLVWIKSRSLSYSHSIFDTIRGATNRLFPNLGDAESVNAASLTAFDSDGFTVGSATMQNKNGASFAAWCWKADQTGFTDNGSGLPQVEKYSLESGLSIIKYTGNATAGRPIKHSLGVPPKMVICKNMDMSESWCVYHASLGPTKFIRLDLGNPALTNSDRWNDTAPSSSIITLGTNDQVNKNSHDYICYAFSEVPGVKIDSYLGTGSDVVVNCGFKPKYVLLRGTTLSSWCIFDINRGSTNVLTAILSAESTSPEWTNGTLTVTSTGFIISAGTHTNVDGTEYIYMAIAEDSGITPEIFIDNMKAYSEANLSRPDNISGLFHISSQGWLRGKASEGFIRPTIKQFLSPASSNFEEISSVVPAYFALQSGTTGTLSNNNLTVSNPVEANWHGAVVPITRSTGKWYLECTHPSSAYFSIGIKASDNLNQNHYARIDSVSFLLGNIYQGAGGSELVENYNWPGEIVTVAYDADNYIFKVFHNGTLAYDYTVPEANRISGEFLFCVGIGSSSLSVTINAAPIYPLEGYTYI